jgi:hypothetical protein
MKSLQPAPLLSFIVRRQRAEAAVTREALFERLAVLADQIRADSRWDVQHEHRKAQERAIAPYSLRRSLRSMK